MIYKSVSILIPVYNEELYISKVIDAVHSADTKGLKKEIIIINDGSNDKTANVLKSIFKKFKNIKVLQNKHNRGKGYSLKRGLLECTGDIVLIQDADLEYSPTNYPDLLQPILNNEADVVYGSRLMTGKPHRVLFFWHYAANKFITTFSNILTGLNLTDMETGYKVFKGALIRSLASDLKSQQFGFEPEITAKISHIPNIKVYEVGISYSGRTYSEGKKITWKDGVAALCQIVRYNLFK